MNLGVWKRSLSRLLLAGILIGLMLQAQGCASFGKTSKQIVLVSKDLSWRIPQGAKFEAIQTPNHPELTEFVAPDDLTVIYSGRLLELEKEANERVVKQAGKSKKQGVLIGSIGSLFAFLSGLIAYLKKSKKKT